MKKPNFGYHFARWEGELRRKTYRALLPAIVYRSVHRSRRVPLNVYSYSGEVMLPELSVGDLLVSPVMGAYTTVTASRFNGRPLTPIAVVGRGPATGEVAAVPVARIRQTVP